MLELCCSGRVFIDLFFLPIDKASDHSCVKHCYGSLGSPALVSLRSLHPSTPVHEQRMTYRLFGEAEYPERVPVSAYEDTGERSGFVASVFPGAGGQQGKMATTTTLLLWIS